MIENIIDLRAENNGCPGIVIENIIDLQQKTIAILGHRWWPQKAKQEGDKAAFFCFAIYGKNTQLCLEVSTRSMFHYCQKIRLYGNL